MFDGDSMSFIKDLSAAPPSSGSSYSKPGGKKGIIQT